MAVVFNKFNVQKNLIGIGEILLKFKILLGTRCPGATTFSTSVKSVIALIEEQKYFEIMIDNWQSTQFSEKSDNQHMFRVSTLSRNIFTWNMTHFLCLVDSLFRTKCDWHFIILEFRPPGGSYSRCSRWLVQNEDEDTSGF